eukprot:GILK01011600.1.p1 GENE.GILK01011600.1~~GILK01011600.1.p1  ORF type:complete len:137 (+),score=15.90 GILK01011600.1:570-980(+)
MSTNEDGEKVKTHYATNAKILKHEAGSTNINYERTSSEPNHLGNLAEAYHINNGAYGTLTVTLLAVFCFLTGIIVDRVFGFVQQQRRKAIVEQILHRDTRKHIQEVFESDRLLPPSLSAMPRHEQFPSVSISSSQY